MLSTGNELIALLSTERHKFARIPLVPGVTEKRENLAAIVDFPCAAGAKNVALLPYNPLGLAMYPLLGKPVPCLPPGFTAPEHERDLVKTFREIVAEKTRQHVSRLTVAH
ncbi:MAG: hypothetical protein ABSF14_13470 [Terriglobia bacterium]|jgi:pyruvate-formate lyase-activating enzyme